MQRKVNTSIENCRGIIITQFSLDAMTTMDSDSESQDSDEGRRFRFETTRKDAITTLQSRRRRISPYSNTSRRRIRSPERSRHTGREDKKIIDSTKERTIHRNHEERQSSKEQKSVNSNSKSNKEVRNRNREPEKAGEAQRVFQKRDSSYQDARGLKSRDGKRKRSRDESRDKHRKYSRGRERLTHRQKSPQRQKRCEERMRDNEKEKSSNWQHKDIWEIHDPQECRDLNLSDFDIVSDTGGNSDNSDEIIKSTNDQMEWRDRNSKENDEVKFRDGDKSSGSYSSSPADVSDFLLASTSCKPISTDSNDTMLHRDGEAGLKKSDSKREPEKDVDKYEDIAEEIYGPLLPPIAETTSYNAVKMIGPSLPDHMQKSVTQDKNDGEDTEFGPALPLHLQKRGDTTVGHVLVVSTVAEKVAEDEEYGVMGPLPADHPTLKDDVVQQQLEYRAQRIKRELAEIDDIEERKRDEWMTELPTVNTSNLGLGARKFRMRAGPDLSDRSDWTDTPADRAKKLKQYAMGKTTANTEQAEKILPEEPRKRKGKSLLEIHQKRSYAKEKMKEKESKKSGKLPERRPFNRDIDLQVNHFDEARKNSVFMKAAALDDRFSSGKM